LIGGTKWWKNLEIIIQITIKMWTKKRKF
jgi:hypothetical protein